MLGSFFFLSCSQTFLPQWRGVLSSEDIMRAFFRACCCCRRLSLVYNSAKVVCVCQSNTTRVPEPELFIQTLDHNEMINFLLSCPFTRFTETALMSSQSCLSYHKELDFESDSTLLFSVINDVVFYCSNLYKEVLSICFFFAAPTQKPPACRCWLFHHLKLDSLCVHGLSTNDMTH